MAEAECISFPVLGELAPDFEAETTQGPIKLSDLKREMGRDVLAPGRFHAGLHH